MLLEMLFQHVLPEHNRSCVHFAAANSILHGMILLYTILHPRLRLGSHAVANRRLRRCNTGTPRVLRASTVRRLTPSRRNT
jgi:hypothetical protein